GFDNITIILDSDGKHQLVYKHAVSTISPLRQISFNYSSLAEQKKTAEEES
ncbi:MAG: RNA chaperone Hfq, partial [Thermoanaerobacterales bacterium]|nr:RNA chaperone Hfq [Thermoanaerobacterales bacterium]